MRAIAIGTLLAGLCFAGSVASAQAPDGGVAGDATPEAEALVRTAHRLYNELDFVGAVAALQRALEVEGASDAVRVNALELLGAAYVVLEQPDEARTTFRTLFEIAPAHQVREPSGSPKITDFVARVRAEMNLAPAAPRGERLAFQLPRTPRAERPLRIRIHALGGGEIAYVRLFVEDASERVWRVYRPNRTLHTFVVVLPPKPAGTELNLYAEGYDADGRAIAHGGSSASPVRLLVRPKREGSFTSKWWFWSGIGVLVAGAVVTSVILLSEEEAPAGSLPPGRVQFP